jgi:hypothetical protein
LAQNSIGDLSYCDYLLADFLRRERGVYMLGDNLFGEWTKINNTQ